MSIQSNTNTNIIISSSISPSLDVLGTGAYGIVLTKPLSSCISKSRKHSINRRFHTTKRQNGRTQKVVKLSYKKDLIQYEYEVMHSLPQAKKYPYAKKSEISICDVKIDSHVKQRLHRLVQSKKIHPDWLEEAMDHGTIYQLTLPRLGTHSLYSELKKYRNPNELNVFYETVSEENANKPFLSLRMGQKILIACESLLHVLIELNQKHVYHNDVRLPNITCHFENKKRPLYLIDFGLSFAQEGTSLVKNAMIQKNYSEYQFEDISSFLENVLEPILFCLCSEKQNYTLFIHHVHHIESLLYDIRKYRISDHSIVFETAKKIIHEIISSFPKPKSNTSLYTKEFIDIDSSVFKIKETIQQQRNNAIEYRNRLNEQYRMKEEEAGLRRS